MPFLSMDGEGEVLCLKLNVIAEVAIKHSSVKWAGNQGSCHLRVLLLTDPMLSVTRLLIGVAGLGFARVLDAIFV